MFGTSNAMQLKMHTPVSRAFIRANKRGNGKIGQKEF